MFPRTVDFIICSSALACGGVGSGGGMRGEYMNTNMPFYFLF